MASDFSSSFNGHIKSPIGWKELKWIKRKKHQQLCGFPRLWCLTRFTDSGIIHFYHSNIFNISLIKAFWKNAQPHGSSCDQRGFGGCFPNKRWFSIMISEIIACFFYSGISIASAKWHVLSYRHTFPYLSCSCVISAFSSLREVKWGIRFGIIKCFFPSPAKYYWEQEQICNPNHYTEAVFLLKTNYIIIKL